MHLLVRGPFRGMDMIGRPITRASDDRLLTWVARRCAGEKPVTIAADFGVHRTSVGMQTKAVRDADLAESGEAVSGVYWR